MSRETVPSFADGSSADLAHDYELAKTQLEKAAEASNMGYAKKRSMLSEVKHFKEQEEEVKMWEKLNRNKVGRFRGSWTHHRKLRFNGIYCGNYTTSQRKSTNTHRE